MCVCVVMVGEGENSLPGLFPLQQSFAAAARQTGDLCTLSLSCHCDVKGLFLKSNCEK